MDINGWQRGAAATLKFTFSHKFSFRLCFQLLLDFIMKFTQANAVKIIGINKKENKSNKRDYWEKLK